MFRGITRNYTAGREGGRVLAILIHTYNGKGRSLYNWFQNNNTGVSAHYAVFLDGGNEQYVREEDRAHHAGHLWWNKVTIGIEHQDNGNPQDSVRTNELYATSARLCFDILVRHGHRVANEHTIKPHNEASATGCPGGLDIARIRKETQNYMDLLNKYEKEAASYKAQFQAEKAARESIQSQLGDIKAQLENELEYSSKLEKDVEALKRRVNKDTTSSLSKLIQSLKRIWK